MNGLKETIEGFLQFYQSTRGAGHTRAIIKGTEKTRKTMVVMDNFRLGSLLKKQKKLKNFVTLDGNLSQLKGLRCPMVWDNSAIMNILERSLGLIDYYERENKILKEQIRQIKEIVK